MRNKSEKVMENLRLSFLIEMYLAGKCSKAEEDELALLIDSVKDDALKSELLAQWEKYTPERDLPDEDSEQILGNIMQSKTDIYPKRKIRSLALRISAIAASLFFILALAVAIKHIAGKQTLQPVIVSEIIKPPSEPTAYTRSLKLPDGSTVVLKAGSSLQFPTRFEGETREVKLSGEAYFDIVHNPKQPFIIHTGTIKTTVLGTAFNIKAWPNDKKVKVTVTRGKVRVEEESRKKILAVLTLNHEAEYDFNSKKTISEQVEAERVVQSWTQQELNFDHVSFEKIARTISKRFGVTIEIEDPKIAENVLITSFTGTESLNDMLDVLCSITSDVKYTHANQTIKIQRIVNH
jgi:transmembrane sensor